MKKTLAILLIAILAAGSMFAAITGQASVDYAYNLDDKAFVGFTNGTKASVTFDFGKDEGLKVGEGDVYASVKATLELKGEIKDAGNGAELNVTPKTKMNFEEAKITNDVWAVSILGAADAAAKAAPLSGDDAVVAKFQKHSGITATYAGNTASFGQDAKSFSATLASAAYTVAEGVTVEAAASYSNVDEKEYAAGDKVKYTLDTATGKVTKTDEGVSTDPAQKQAMASVKAAYTTDVVTASVASDVVYDALTKDVTYDARLDATYDFVNASVYYDKDIDVQAIADLDSFDIPVKVTAIASDLLGDKAATVKAEGTYDFITVKANAKLNSMDFKAMEYGVEVAAEKAIEYGTVKAAVAYNNKKLLSASMSIENETLVPGAKLGLAWSDAGDLLGKDAGLYTFADGTTADKVILKDADAPTAKNIKDFGVIKASCTIAF